MSPNERRTRRGILRSAGAFVAELPFRIADLLPRRKKGGRRADRKWTRPRRIAVGLTVVVGLGGGAAALILVVKGRRSAGLAWRLHDEAIDQFRAGRYEAAAATYREILAMRPDDGRARFDLGASLMALGRRDEGLGEIRAAARADPAFDEAHMVLAQDAASRGDEETELAELRLVVAAPPSPGVAEAMVADILRRRGRDSEAMPHLAAAAADPLADPLLRVQSGIALGRIHGLRATVPVVAAHERQQEIAAYADARRTVEDALAVPGRTDAAAAGLHTARAEILLAVGKPREALVDADVALAATTDPADRAALRLLRAQIYGVAGDAAAAEKELDDALSSAVAPPPAAFRGAAAIQAARGQLPRALEILAKGAAAHPDDAETGLDRAGMLFQTGDLDGAQAECERIAAADARGTAALLLAGDIRRARDDMPGARAAYEKAAARRPDDPEARLRIAGTAFAESGEASPDAAQRLAESERIANDVLAASPGDPGALLALAKVRLAKSPGRDPPGRTENSVNAQARDLLVEAVKGDPLSLEARTFLGYAWYLTRDSQEAAAQIQQVLARVPGERPRLRLLLARCLLDGRAYRDAAAQAERACAGLADSPDAWTVLADAAHAAGDRDGALRALRRLEELEPANLQHLFAEAAVLAEGGRFAEAEERFAVAETGARAVAGEDARAAAEMNVATARAEFYRLRGDIERAKGTLGALVEKGPPTAAPYVRYARFLAKLGQDEEAERQVQRGLAAEPASVEARRALCEIWFGRGTVAPELVNAQIQEIVRIAPKDPVADYLRGKLSTSQGDLRLGREFLTRYADARPDDPDAQYALGVTLAKAGEYADAVKRLETAGELLPGSPEVRVALAKTRQSWAVEMMRRGRLVEAQATLRRVVSDDPSQRDARALLVDSLRALGEVALSEKEVRALLQADPSDRAALRMLAALEVQGGRLGDAAATLKRLTAAAPDDWTAWQFLSAVLADKGDLDAADVAARAARSAAPDEPGSLAAMLHVLVRRGDFDGAEREIAAAAQRHPDEARYALFLAMLREQQDRHEEAVAAAGKALDLRPALPSALQLAIHALSSGLSDSERAASFARERVAKAKDDAAMAYLLAALESDLGHRDAALALLKPVCEADTPIPAALALRCLLVLDTHDYVGARALLTKAIERYADAPDLHYLLAQSWMSDPANVKDGELQEPARAFAIAELRNVVKVAKGHAPALNNLAWLLSRDEATRAEALECAETMVQAYPAYAPYLDTWGTVLLRLGRGEQAVSAFRRALGACEAERAAIDKRAAAKMSTVDAAKVDAARKRVERTRSEAQAHFDEAVKATSGH